MCSAEKSCNYGAHTELPGQSTGYCVPPPGVCVLHSPITSEFDLYSESIMSICLKATEVLAWPGSLPINRGPSICPSCPGASLLPPACSQPPLPGLTLTLTLGQWAGLWLCLSR